MNLREYGLLFAVLLLLLACISGCTTTQKTTTGSSTPVTTLVAGAAGTPASTQSSSVTQAATSSGIITTINIHYNDYLCIDVQKELGSDYLYPDQKFNVWATSPAGSTINVNVLLLKVGDYEKIQTVKPAWDAVKKTWVYEGLAPLVQFNDITTPQEKTITIPAQGKYYLCADDRKESGTNDAIFRIPVKMTRV